MIGLFKLLFLLFPIYTFWVFIRLPDELDTRVYDTKGHRVDSYSKSNSLSVIGFYLAILNIPASFFTLLAPNRTTFRCIFWCSLPICLWHILISGISIYTHYCPLPYPHCYRDGKYHYEAYEWYSTCSGKFAPTIYESIISLIFYTLFSIYCLVHM